MELMILAALLASAQEPQRTEPAPEEPIVVTGGRPGENRPEPPYPETERTPVGSRITRRNERRTFRTVASDQGLAGLISAPGLDFDGAGGATPRFRNRVVTECVAGNSQVSERTACALFRVRQAIERQNYAAAAETLEPLLRSGTLSGIDRYYVASFNYQLAQATDDDSRREAALTAMIESGRMPPADRTTAIRMLARLAAERGDSASAIARLERLVADNPAEPRNHADLAWLYVRAGRDGEAVPRMQTAVRLARESGQPVPPAWLAFLTADP